jgi:hypothetical protein
MTYFATIDLPQPVDGLSEAPMRAGVTRARSA